MEDYKSKPLAERICRVLEGLVLLEHKPSQDLFSGLVYMYCHLVSNCEADHQSWMEDFERTEQLVHNALACPKNKNFELDNSVVWSPIDVENPILSS